MTSLHTHTHTHTQRQMVSFEAPFPLLTHHLRQLSPDTTGLLYQGKQAVRVSQDFVFIVLPVMCPEYLKWWLFKSPL